LLFQIILIKLSCNQKKGVAAVWWLKDKDGYKFLLAAETWEHIQEFHPEIIEVEMIEFVLLIPDTIVQSNWDEESILYYKQISERRFRVVVVQKIEKRIKTTLTTDKVKRGEVLWKKK
jgi:hypothetical protein